MTEGLHQMVVFPLTIEQHQLKNLDSASGQTVCLPKGGID
jgi:hypothetical protein